MNLFFDTETTGLFSRGATYKNLDEFNKARLVSICWMVAQGDNIVEQYYYVIKPDGFTVPPESTAIHGITHDYAQENGIYIKEVLDLLIKSIDKCTHLVAHNIKFDISIIKSELYRYGYKDSINQITTKHIICTMVKGRQFMKVRKFPKLGELYKFLYNEDISNAHCALDDTRHCFKCFIKLFPSDPSVFFFGDKKVNLTDEQQKVTFEALDKNMLVIAAAGSGKTTTVITRIKHLLDKGVPESSIILTTFTRNAANDMRDKLFDIMGYKSEIVVGTIDSIAKYYVELDKRQSNTNDEMEILDVSDYAPKFLDMINKRQSFFSTFRYLIVDEMQDINDIQFNIINAFYKNGVYIVGIGDDSQNIYEFRGSNIKYILYFDKFFTNSVKHMLTKNFRSTKEIVALANASIDKNTRKIPKRMIAANPKILSEIHQRPKVEFFSTPGTQYGYVLKKIKEYIANGINEDAICIMSPINKPLQEMNKILTENEIKCFYASASDESKTLKMPEHISLNTIHRAKGLEYSIVFLIGMNDDQNKNIYKYHNGDKLKCLTMLEANRRLFYVAVTRAKRELYICTDNNEFTRFITEVDPNLFA